MTQIPDVLDKRLIKDLTEITDRENSFFQRAFRDHNGDNAGSEATFPDFSEEDAIEPGEYAETEEGDPFPASTFSYDAQSVAYAKYGVTLRVSDEEVEDNELSVVMDSKRQALRAEQQRVDGIAYSTLASTAVSSGVGDGSGALGLADLVKARSWMKKAPRRYDPDLCYVEPDGASDVILELFNSNNSNVGGDELQNGEVGSVADMTIIEANTGDLSSGEALLVDSDEYGWESEKWSKKIEEERKPRKQITEYTVSDRLAFAATTPDAAATVKG